MMKIAILGAAGQMSEMLREKLLEQTDDDYRYYTG